MVNPRNRIEERAAHYSFNADSALFQALPMELQAVWKQEIEQAYRAGANEMYEKPTGGALLYVCNKSSARGRRDAIDDAISVIRDYALDGVNGGFCNTLIRKIEKFRVLK